MEKNSGLKGFYSRTLLIDRPTYTAKIIIRQTIQFGALAYLRENFKVSGRIQMKKWY